MGKVVWVAKAMRVVGVAGLCITLTSHHAEQVLLRVIVQGCATRGSVDPYIDLVVKEGVGGVGRGGRGSSGSRRST